jgi:cation:H+ antiporter
MAGAATHFAIGLVLLLIGAQLLVRASVDTARRLKVSPLVVGLTLVAWGTSMPEFALNLTSAIKGRGDLALGNVVGANICNMSLVLGLSAMFKPLPVQDRLIRVEIWLNALILVFMAGLGLLSGFKRWEAGLMLAVFGVYSLWTILAALRAPQADALEQAVDPLNLPGTPQHPPMDWVRIGIFFAIGLAMLSYGGTLASDGAAGMSLAVGVPAAVVGVTVVSIGTTLPELVTSVLAVRKGETDLALGNALGSCLFNAGAIFGMAGLIAPPSVGSSFALPLAYMAILALALIPLSRTFHHTVARVEGAGLLASYGAFLGLAAWRCLRG